MALCQPSKLLPEAQSYKKKAVGWGELWGEGKRVISIPSVRVAFLDGFQNDLSRRS